MIEDKRLYNAQSQARFRKKRQLELNALRLAETPYEDRDRLVEEEATHQHAASAAQPSPVDPRGFGFGEPEFEPRSTVKAIWEIK